MPIDGSLAGRAFLGDELVEQPAAGSVRVFVPLLDGTDRVGVLAFTSDTWDDDDRRLARRFGGLLADVLVTKGIYTDRFFQARRRADEPVGRDAVGAAAAVDHDEPPGCRGRNPGARLRRGR